MRSRPFLPRRKQRAWLMGTTVVITAVSKGSKALLKLPEETFLHHPQHVHNRCTLRQSHDLSYITTESSSALYPFGVSFTGKQEISFAAYVHGGFTKDDRCRSVPSHNIFFS